MSLKRVIALGSLLVLGAAVLMVMLERRRATGGEDSGFVGPEAGRVQGSRNGQGLLQNVRASPDTTNREQALRVLPGQVLATVNGRAIKLGDLLPLHAGNTNAAQLLSRETYDYLLRRAVERELITQAAKAQGVELTSDQKQQLASVRAAREQREPGQVKRLSLDEAQLDFEMRDAEAFLLQNNLLARSGVSPDVSEEQVQNYYQAHVSEFGELPTDETARKVEWSKIDYSIRQQLSGPVRAQFQAQLTDYMGRLKAGAQVAFTPLPETD